MQSVPSLLFLMKNIPQIKMNFWNERQGRNYHFGDLMNHRNGNPSSNCIQDERDPAISQRIWPVPSWSHNRPHELIRTVRIASQSSQSSLWRSRA
jgi:hypothetical protein